MACASSSATVSGSSLKVSVTVTVEPASNHDDKPEWEVLDPPAPVLEFAVRNRLAARLSSKQAKVLPRVRIEQAFQAGAESAGRDLHCEEVVPPTAVGIQNSCWLGVRADKSLWAAGKRRTADKHLRKEPTTRAEAEAWCLGYGADFPAFV